MKQRSIILAAAAVLALASPGVGVDVGRAHAATVRPNTYGCNASVSITPGSQYVSPYGQAQFTVKWDCQSNNGDPSQPFSFHITYGDGGSEDYTCNFFCNFGQEGRVHTYTTFGTRTVTVTGSGGNGGSIASATVYVQQT